MFSMLLAPLPLSPFAPPVVTGSCSYSLAVALATVEDSLGDQLAGVLSGSGLLGQNFDATLLVGNDTDGLLYDQYSSGIERGDRGRFVGAIHRTLSLTKPACLRVCRFFRFRGSRENRTPPPSLRVTR